MEKDLALTLLLQQKDYLGAAKYVESTYCGKRIRAGLAEVIDAARRDGYGRLDELVDEYGEQAGLEPSPVSVHDWTPGAFDGPLTVEESDIIASESRAAFDEMGDTGEWDEIPTKPFRPLPEEAS